MILGIPGLETGESIGEGGNAIVYRAHDTDHDRVVAVKMLKGLADEDARRRFDRERRLMGRLSNHDGIVTIYSSGFNDRDVPYLVMPYLSNGSLEQLVKSGTSPRHAAELVAEVARAVGAAHSQGVVHRDLKPGNILLSDSNRPLVSDFGIARLAEGATQQTSQLAYTPAYSPPEVMAGSEPGAAGDVYSLGATLFALLAGRAPFGAGAISSPYPVITRVMNESVEDLSGEVPEVLCDIYQRAMSKDAADRPTIEEFVELLDGALTELSDAKQTPTINAADLTRRSPATAMTSPSRRSTLMDSVGLSRGAPRRSRRRLVLALLLVSTLAAVIVAVLLSSDPSPNADTTASGGVIETPASSTTETPPSSNTEALETQPSTDETPTSTIAEAETLNTTSTATIAASASATTTAATVSTTSPTTTTLATTTTTTTPATITLPNVVGNNHGSAVNTLTAAGFAVLPCGNSCSMIVTRQSPVGGSSLTVGSTVTLTFTPNELQEIPNVVGLTGSQAVTVLSVQKPFLTSCGSSCAAIVTGMSPGAGGSALPLTFISLSFS